MKKILLFILVVASVAACRGPRGYQGDPGVNILGQTFEVRVSFGYEPAPNLWSALIDIPNGVSVYDSDAILVYRLETVSSSTGGTIDTYSLIPQDFFLNEGIIEYVYNHTANDVEILIDGNFNLSNLNPVFTDNQIFRIVVVPSEWANRPDVHIETYESLLDSGLDLEDF